MNTITKFIYAAFALFAFACFALLPTAQAVSPPPDGGYANFNTAEGQNALLDLTTGLGNTAVGWFSLGSITTASYNTALGGGALVLNTGDANTAVGTVALLGNTSGANNTALGIGAGINQTTGSNNIYIGDTGVAGESNVIAIGRTSFSGTPYTSFFAGAVYGTTTGSGTTLPVIVDEFGQLGTTASAARFKKEIKPMDKASESILALRPVTFRYKSDTKGVPQFGLVAEEVAAVNPDLVVRDKRGEIYSVRYDAVNAMLLNEFLKEHKTVEERQATITELKKDMHAAIAQLHEQAAELRNLSAQVELTKPATQTVRNDR